MSRVYIGEQLVELRSQAGLTQMALAEALGVHWRSIQDWETGRTAVDSYKAEALLKEAERLVRKNSRKKEPK
jgi:DNA-binding transcriptional regulator YiaG